VQISEEAHNLPATLMTSFDEGLDLSAKGSNNDRRDGLSFRASQFVIDPFDKSLGRAHD
jgi:hypothetical protein